MRIQKLTSGNAGLVPGLISKVFGDTYSDELFYSPEQLVEAHTSGEYLSYVAIDTEGVLRGILALYIRYMKALARIELIALDPALPMVDRSVVIFKLIESFRNEVAEIRDAYRVHGIVSLETLAHTATQRIVVRTGFTPAGIYLGYMPPELSRIRGDHQPSTGVRTSSTLSFFWLDRSRKPYTVSMPARFAEIAAEIYRAGGLPTTIRVKGGGQSATGAYEVKELFDARWKRAVIRVYKQGLGVNEDVLERISRALQDSMNIIHVFLPLSEVDISVTVECLVNRGFRFGALIPGYSAEGSDVIVLQYLNGVRHDAAMERIYSPLARKIFAVTQTV